MGTLSGGPNIVTDGLVLHLDAANTKSYPGNGNIWYDLSGRNNHFTLVNNPVVENGSFNFTTNEYAALTITSSNVQVPELLPDNESFTVEVTYKYSTSGSNGKFIGTGNYGRGGWNIGVGSSQFNQIIFSSYDERCTDGVNCQYNRGNVTYNITHNTTSFFFYQLVYNYGIKTTSIYVNGILGASVFDNTYGTSPNPQGLGNASSFVIGLNTQGGWGSKKGNCGCVRYYNRALSAQEVLQNYNTTKTRFGL